MKNAISIEQPESNLIQRVKWQYLSLAAGLGLAATAAIGIGGHTSTPAQPAPPVRSAIATVAAPQDRPTVVFYLAKSPEAATLARSYEEMAQWIRVEGNVPEPKRSVVILDATTEDASGRAYKMVEEAMAAANFVGYDAPQFVVSELP